MLTEAEEDRLLLLDRLADRVPELALDQRAIEWTTLEDGHEALLVDGGGVDGGEGCFFANAGENVHAIGSLAPLLPGTLGCVVLRPDGTRVLTGLERDPSARPDAD